jgi:truncated hemoglobin YjbI
MRAAMRQMDWSPALIERLAEAFQGTADWMRNRPG